MFLTYLIVGEVSRVILSKPDKKGYRLEDDDEDEDDKSKAKYAHLVYPLDCFLYRSEPIRLCSEFQLIVFQPPQGTHLII